MIPTDTRVGKPVASFLEHVVSGDPVDPEILY